MSWLISGDLQYIRGLQSWLFPSLVVWLGKLLSLSKPSEMRVIIIVTYAYRLLTPVNSTEQMLIKCHCYYYYTTIMTSLTCLWPYDMFFLSLFTYIPRFSTMDLVLTFWLCFFLFHLLFYKKTFILWNPAWQPKLDFWYLMIYLGSLDPISHSDFN